MFNAVLRLVSKVCLVPASAHVLRAIVANSNVVALIPCTELEDGNE